MPSLRWDKVKYEGEEEGRRRRRTRRRRRRLCLMGVKLVSEVDFVPINLVETSKRHRWRCLRLESVAQPKGNPKEF